MRRFDTHEAARIVALPERSIRACVRAGVLVPERGADGVMRFGFRDLLVLRATKGLLDSGLPSGRVTRSLGALRRQLPDDAHLSGLTLSSEGGHMVVSDGAARWEPDSGQVLLDFDASFAERGDAPPPDAQPIALPPRPAAAQRATARPRLVAAGAPDEDEGSAESWFAAGCDLEAESLEEARRAYARALELDPKMADAHVNLGRLDHEAGELGRAEVHYRTAVAEAPDDPVPHFNLGVLLEERGRRDEAVYAYRQALARDPEFADAHCNLGLLRESMGRRDEAVRHLMEARRLYEGPAGS